MRFEEAKILYKNKQYSGAYYLAGYAIELGMKACFCKKIKKYTMPNKQAVNNVHVHDLNSLRKTCEFPPFPPSGSTNQLMHVSRYIHLNPYSARLIGSKEEIEQYPYSSFAQYIGEKSSELIYPEKVLELFSHDSSASKDFVIRNADYQQTLERVEYTYKW